MKFSPVDLLKKYWGHPSFRPLQEEIITSALQHQDTLVLMPTGGGKSVCYQLPALMEDGLTLVISPLIALMNDQVEQLKQKGIKAACIHSHLHYREIERILDAGQFGKLKLLYLAPERLRSPEFEVRLKRLPVQRLVVDEAHCVSMWGYDFRPAYLDIAQVREWLPGIAVMALTATASPEVLSDIQNRLELKQPQIFRASFLRPNLKFGVLPVEDKKQRMYQLLKQIPGPAIIYVRSRRQTGELAEWLIQSGIRATYYHAGREPEMRSLAESDFQDDKVRVMVATNAFGMGIDKANVRLVIHWSAPDNLEAYYQEAGRAGRDGKDAYAILLYQHRDFDRLWKQFDQSFPSMHELRRVYRALGNYLKLAVGSGEGGTFPFDIEPFAKRYDLDVRHTWNSLKVLEQAGWFTLSDAVFQPARLKMTTSRESLYDYQLRHPTKDKILRVVLRLYQGVFRDYVPIQESKIAGFAGLSRAKLTQLLLEIQQEGLIQYEQQQDTGYLTMLQPRVSPENLTIDQQLLDFRKRRHQAGLETMEQYVGLKRCRQAFITHYFGDSWQGICGVCDNCRQASVHKHDKQDFYTLKKLMTKELGTQGREVRELLHQFRNYPRDVLLKVLQHLEDEEIIVRHGSKLSLNESRK